MSIFSFPDGLKFGKKDNQSVNNIKLHHFVRTTGSLNFQYGTSLIFSEIMANEMYYSLAKHYNRYPLNNSNAKIYIQKGICLLSK